MYGGPVERVLSRLAAVDVVAVDVVGRRCGRSGHRGSMDNVVVSTSARWWHRSFRHQIQILQSIIYRDAVSMNDLETWRYASAVSLPRKQEE